MALRIINTADAKNEPSAPKKNGGNDQTASWLRPFVTIASVAASVGVGVGVGFALAANGKSRDAAQKLDELRNDPSSGSPVCPASTESGA